MNPITGGSIGSLQAVLDQLYQTMLPMCSQLIGVGQALAGFAALSYIGVRVGRSLAAAEPVEVFPLLRPFAIGLAILLFPSVIGLINGVLQPTVDGTESMVTSSNQAIATLLQQKEALEEQGAEWQMFVGPEGGGSLDKWESLSGQADSGVLSGLSNRIKFEMAKASYNLRNSIKVWLSEVLQVLYEAAALCINTLRTFQLLLLAILGPLVLGMSVLDGLRNSLWTWLARYINVFLWLPVANIFGAIIGTVQSQLIAIDIQQLQSSGTTFFSSTDVAYLIFLIIGIVGYFTVPSTAGYIVNAGGSSPLVTRTAGLVSRTIRRLAGRR
jgi:conjugative transposon TraJ protein